MDRQIKAERAWLIPYRLSKKLGDFSISTLAALSLAQLTGLMTKPEHLHRFAPTMSRSLHAGIRRIVEHYDGSAANIWRGRPPSAEVVYRFLEFEGVGPKIATMATNILAREFKVPFSDHYSIDISADTHVRRVFGRLGLCTPKAPIEQIIYKARALHPEFPGMMDLPCWEIGTKWCKVNRPLCADCYMNRLCPTARKQSPTPSDESDTATAYLIPTF